MKKMFKFATLAAIAALAFSATACSSDDEPEVTESEYFWGITKGHEESVGDLTSGKEFEAKKWVTDMVASLRPQTDGSGKFTEDSQLQPINNAVKDVMFKAMDDYVEAQKNYDFGPYYYKVTYEFRIHKGESTVLMPTNFVFEYNGFDRIESSVVLEENVSIAKETTVNKTLTLKDFDITDNPGLVITGDVRVFNSETRNVYKGTSFVTNVEVTEGDNGETGVNITLDFKKEHADEYRGSWYLLIPTAPTVNDKTTHELMVPVILK